MSESRIEQARLYPKLVKQFFLTHHECFRCGDKVPEKLKQNHHFFGRIQELLCWIPGFRLVCPWCHVWIEMHRNESVKLGYRAPDNLFNRPSLVIPK